MVTSALSTVSPCSSRARRTASKRDGSVVTSTLRPSTRTSSAPASIAASPTSSGSRSPAATSITPLRSNIQATEFASPRLPPCLEKMWRMAGAVRLRLSVTTSTMIATPAGPDARALLVHVTRESGLRVAAAMDHLVQGPEGTETRGESEPDLARLTVAAVLERGQCLRLIKFLAYGWSAQRSLPAIRDQVEGALAMARHRGWEGLLADQRAYLDDFWRRADVEIEGDPELQHAVRFALFQVLQAGARAERRAIPAKGLTGP